MNCKNCPCPEICLKWEPFCASAAKEPQEPVEIRHICERSRIAAGQPLEYPSLIQMTGNFWRSMKGFVASGGKLAPKSVRVERMAICKACEWFDASQKRCKKCGCASSAKVFVAADKCPLDPPKWGAVNQDAPTSAA